MHENHPDAEGHGIIPRWLLYSPHVSPHAKLVYVTIQSHANARATSWPKRSTIAEECGLSEASVKRATLELERLGVIEVERRRRPDGRQMSSVYLVFSALPEPGDNSHE